MTYQIDPKHSRVHFKVRHMMIANVRGEFTNVTGTVDFDPEHPEKSRIDASIDVNSLHTGDAQRDGHVKTPYLMDAAKYPAITFRSKKVTAGSPGQYLVTGDFTLKGASKEVTLEVDSVSQEVTDPWGQLRRGISASGCLSRKDFGMGWNMELPGVGVMVSDNVDVTVDLEMTRPKG